MGNQTFNAAVGQVAAGNIINHPKWDQLPTDALMRFEREYRRERRKAFFSQWFNLAALLILIVCFACGAWAWYLLKVDGLTGEVGSTKMAVFITLAVAMTASAFWLHMIRQTAKTTIEDLNSDLKEISSVLRFRKTKR
ncbi:hypothetical protein TX25_06060 [Pseudomonas lactis]|uniref:hypothetical protein n=1 Tax=Pseudomonas lactis TaxID=1615674 RepID=UPI000713D7B1|nr:hypothetical protein [Pseudomonas lactis]KRP97467.1 hypothetical protein TX25_06060 [Pseudomonas lactis]